MAIVKSRCPNCGEISEIESDEFNVVCRFCGVPFMPKEGIDSYNNYIINNVDVDTVNIKAENISSYAMLGIASLKDKNAEKCGFYADDILKRDPINVDGLLLKAYFINNNYSKEEGIRYYFLAFENCKDNEKFLLIQNTFFESILNYSIENFSFFFESILKKDLNKYFDLFSYGLSVYFSRFEDSVSQLSFFNVMKALNKESVLVSENIDCNLYFIDHLLLLVKDDKVVNAVSLLYVSKEVQKYFNKKQEYKYTYYFALNDSVVGFNYIDEDVELESLLNKNGCTVNFVKNGCYVATCVYGDYYSKEVCVLRRFRDFGLKKSLIGRLFIQFYYFVSPTFVKLFGQKKWFNCFNKKILDKIVSCLKNKGYKDTFYRD